MAGSSTFRSSSLDRLTRRGSTISADVRALSRWPVKKLRAEITRLGGSHKGLKEKDDLVEAARQLQQEQQVDVEAKDEGEDAGDDVVIEDDEKVDDVPQLKPRPKREDSIRKESADAVEEVAAVDLTAGEWVALPVAPISDEVVPPSPTVSEAPGCAIYVTATTEKALGFAVTHKAAFSVLGLAFSLALLLPLLLAFGPDPSTPHVKILWLLHTQSPYHVTSREGLVVNYTAMERAGRQVDWELAIQRFDCEGYGRVFMRASNPVRRSLLAATPIASVLQDEPEIVVLEDVFFCSKYRYGSTISAGLLRQQGFKLDNLADGGIRIHRVGEGGQVGVAAFQKDNRLVLTNWVVIDKAAYERAGYWSKWRRSLSRYWET